MKINPKDKLHMDLLLEKKYQKSRSSSWVKWIIILIASQISLYLFNQEIVTGVVGKVLAVFGIIGVFSFIFFLSTKPFGRSNTSLWWRLWF